MRYTSVKEYEKSLSGGEPSWKNKETSLTQALNWYNYHSDYAESKKFTIEYLKEIKENKNVISLIEKVPDQKFQNLGFVCRMKLRGAPLTEKNNMWIQKFINELKKEKQPQEKEKIESPVNLETPVISVQEKTAEKSKEYISELDSLIDDFVITKNLKKVNTYEMMIKLGIKKGHVSHIKKFFEKRLREYNEVQNSKDAQVKEGYSNFNKKQLKELISLVELILSDLDRIVHNAKVTRKPRKKKSVSVEKVLSKIQYKKTDEDLKISSINPSDILGSSQLWVFNTKTRKLGCYYAKDQSGFSIKGTTLLNFNEESSVQKNVRKPDVIIPDIIKSGKIAIKKLFVAINSVEQQLTGRLNADTILLKVIK